MQKKLENRKWKLNKRIFLLFLISYFFISPSFVYAQLVPCGGPGQEGCTALDLFQLVVNIYNFLVGLAGLVALLFLILGGMQMMLGFLDEKGSYVESGKTHIRNGIIGIVIVACAYLIVNTLIALLGGGGIKELLTPFDLGGFF